MTNDVQLSVKSVVRNDGKHLLVVSSVLIPHDVLLLLIKYLVSYIGNIIVLHISFQSCGDIRILLLINQIYPVASTDTVTLTASVSFVAENSSLVKGAVECTNNSVLGVSDDKFFELIDLIANVTLSSFDEDDFVDFIQFLKEHGSSFFVSWL